MAEKYYLSYILSFVSAYIVIALYIRLHGHGKVETLKACVEIF